MPDKKTYPIDEQALREKLLGYRVEFSSESLLFLENEVAQVKTHKPIEFPETKKILQLIAIPVVLGLLGTATYFGYTYIKQLPKSEVKTDRLLKDKDVVEKKIPDTVHSASVATNVIATVPEHTVATIKKDSQITVVSLPKKTKETPFHHTTIGTPEPVIKNDSATAVKNKNIAPDSLDKKTKADTSKASKTKENNVLKKKKKKRKNALDATDDIRQSQPNSSDDDVVIPEKTN